MHRGHGQNRCTGILVRFAQLSGTRGCGWSGVGGGAPLIGGTPLRGERLGERLVDNSTVEAVAIALHLRYTGAVDDPVEGCNPVGGGGVAGHAGV